MTLVAPQFGSAPLKPDRWSVFIAGLSLCVVQGASAVDIGPSALPTEFIPMITEDEMGMRTAPLLEWGNPFLDTGRIGEPWQLPTGAVWSPSLWVFGGFRTALSAVDDEASDRNSEWSNRLDLFANLQLTGTERVLLGITPLHEGGNFSTYTFKPDSAEGWNDASGAHVSTFFIEGELAELFPRVDRNDSIPLDFGFSLGRQSIEFQDGFLANDIMDVVGIVKNSNSVAAGINNARFTFIYAWNHVNRDDNREDDAAKLYGLFSQWDLPKVSIELDAIYVDGDESLAAGSASDSWHLGASASRRIGRFSSVFRALASGAEGADSAAASDGYLLFAELSTSPLGSENIAYLTGFWGVDQYSSAARNGSVGGPLGRAGILFASAGLGNYRPALSNRTGDIAGTALGYQMFLGGFRRQLIVEAAYRHDRSDADSGGYGLGLHYQQRLTQRLVWRMDAYAANNDSDRGTSLGLRSELRVQF